MWLPRQYRNETSSDPVLRKGIWENAELVSKSGVKMFSSLNLDRGVQSSAALLQGSLLLNLVATAEDASTSERINLCTSNQPPAAFDTRLKWHLRKTRLNTAWPISVQVWVHLAEVVQLTGSLIPRMPMTSRGPSPCLDQDVALRAAQWQGEEPRDLNHPSDVGREQGFAASCSI